MQSKTLLQPNAFGTRNSSGKSKTKSSAKNVETQYGVTGFKPVFVMVIPINGVPIVQKANHSISGKIPKVTTLYENSTDQNLYRSLRNEGRTAKEARDTLRLLGVEPKDKSKVPDSYWNGYVKENKAQLPYYFRKRRF